MNYISLMNRIRKGEFLDKINIDKQICEVRDGGGGGCVFGVPFFSLYCYDDEENSVEVKIPTPITFDEKWFEKI